MKNYKKLCVILFVSLLILFFIPSLSQATVTPVTNEDDLLSAINNVQDGDTISLSNNISLSKPVEINNSKNFTINGNGHTISRNTSSWQTTSANGTLITAGGNTTLTLSNLILENSEKYGVQAYNGGYVILDNVNIINCGYGGVLINAGTVEVKKLYLGHNGRADSNNGIEIAKSEAISESENDPTLKMNGSIETNQTVNVIYVDINDPIADFSVINTDNTVNKVLLNGDKLVVTDQSNNILYESNSVEGVDIQAEAFTKNIFISVHLNNEVATITTQEGLALTEDQIRSQINLESLNLNNYTIEAFYSDPQYTEKIEFPQMYFEDTTIYAKLVLNEDPEDITPKTGINNILRLSILVFALSFLGLIVLKRKDI